MIRHAVIGAVALIVCAAPGAATDAGRAVRTASLCDAIRDAIAVGERDWTFASLQSKAIPLPSLADVDKDNGNGVPALLRIDGFECQVRTSMGSNTTPIGSNDLGGNTGFFDCSRHDLPEGGAEAERIAGTLGRCLGIAPGVGKAYYGNDYTFVWRNDRKIEIMVMPNGLKNEGVIVEVIADDPSPTL